MHPHSQGGIEHWHPPLAEESRGIDGRHFHNKIFSVLWWSMSFEKIEIDEKNKSSFVLI
jgi:hypothetical protein